MGVSSEAFGNSWLIGLQRQRQRRVIAAVAAVGIAIGALGESAVRQLLARREEPAAPQVERVSPVPVPAPEAVARPVQKRAPVAHLAAHRRAAIATHPAPAPLAPVASNAAPAPAPTAAPPPPPPPEPAVQPDEPPAVVAAPAEPKDQPPDVAVAPAAQPSPAEIIIPDDVGVGDHFPSLVPEHPLGAASR